MISAMTIQGVALGFAIAAPIGPIGMLVMRRAVVSGWFHGFLSGLGAALADGVFGAVAAFGLTAVSDFVVSHAVPLRLVGGIVLTVFAALAWVHAGGRAAEEIERRAEEEEEKGVRQARAWHLPFAEMPGVFFITISNPITLFAFASIFAGLGIVADTAADAWAFVIGIVVGSALWWLVLASIAGAARHRLSVRTFFVIDRIAAVVLLAFAAAAFLAAFGYLQI